MRFAKLQIYEEKQNQNDTTVNTTGLLGLITQLTHKLSPKITGVRNKDNTQ